MKRIVPGMAAAMILIASPAYAAPLLFSFTGNVYGTPKTGSFQLDSNPTPSSVNDQSAFGLTQIFFNNVQGVFNGTSEIASSISFGTGGASQFQFQSPSSGFAQFGGATVFSGSLNSPVFNPGTYAFTGFTSGTLTISNAMAAVPEPATWAMMMVGFGAAGFVMRRRKPRPSVSYAA